MKTIFIILIIVGGIILLGALIKILTRNKGESSSGSDSENSLLERASSVVNKGIGCCKKGIRKLFGGGA